jgi:hypothetical protein
MTLLNRPSDGLASVLLALHRAIIAFGPKSESDLIALVAPPAMLSDAKPDMARRTLTRWLQLGFFSGGKSEPVRLSVEIEGLDPADPEAVRTAILRIIFSRKNNTNLLSTQTDDEPEFSGAADLTRALAWMLIQDPFNFPNTLEEAESLQSKQALEPKPFINNTRWNGFEEWSVFLGMAIVAGGRLTPNPALALSCFLKEIVNGRSELSQAEFLEGVAATLPILDGGYLRRTVEEQIKNPWSKVGPNDLSPSLSMALLTLEAQQVLRLEMRSDAASRTLLGIESRAFRQFSHVSFTGGQK